VDIDAFLEAIPKPPVLKPDTFTFASFHCEKITNDIQHVTSIDLEDEDVVCTDKLERHGIALLLWHSLRTARVREIWKEVHGVTLVQA